MNKQKKNTDTAAGEQTGADRLNIPYNEKLCLSIKEAAKYSMIGEGRLRKIIDEDKTLNWVLYVGSQVRIKRPLFEKWALEQNYL